MEIEVGMRQSTVHFLLATVVCAPSSGLSHALASHAEPAGALAILPPLMKPPRRLTSSMCTTATLSQSHPIVRNLFHTSSACAAPDPTRPWTIRAASDLAR